MPFAPAVITINDAFLTPRGYEQLTVNELPAKSLNPPTGATLALVQVVSDNCRWRDDGTDPTKSVGMMIFKEETIQYNGIDLNDFKIAGTKNGVEVNVTYYSYATEQEVPQA